MKLQIFWGVSCFLSWVSLAGVHSVKELLHALDVTPNGGTIQIESGTYLLDAPITIPANKSLKLIGAGRDVTIFDAQGKTNAFVFLSTLANELSGVTVRNGRGAPCLENDVTWYAGGVVLRGGCVKNCRIENCQTHSPTKALGGGITAWGFVQDTVISNCSVHTARANHPLICSGGGMLLYGGPGAKGCEVIDCTAEGGYGGGVEIFDKTPLEASTVRNCFATVREGGVHLNSGGRLVNVRLEGNRSEGDCNPNTDWMRGAIGVFQHRLYGKCPESLEAMKMIDPQKLAQQLADIGADYFCITLNQCEPSFLAPNDAYEDMCGYRCGEMCSQRDVPAELYEALHAKGIRLMLYSTGTPPRGDTNGVRRIGYVDRGVKTDPLYTPEGVKNWARVFEFWSKRYGEKVSGWWIDGCYEKGGFVTSGAAKVFNRALRAGNPKCVITFNPGIRLMPYSAYEDYICGEINYPFAETCQGRWLDGRQWHLLTYLYGHVNRTLLMPYLDCEWVDWLANVTRHGGCVTIDVPSYGTALLRPAFAAQLKRVIGNVKGTKPIAWLDFQRALLKRVQAIESAYTCLTQDNVRKLLPEQADWKWQRAPDRTRLRKGADGKTIYTDAIQTALDKFGCVYLPPSTQAYYIDRPIVLKKGQGICGMGRCENCKIEGVCAPLIVNAPGARDILVKNVSVGEVKFEGVAGVVVRNVKGSVKLTDVESFRVDGQFEGTVACMGCRNGIVRNAHQLISEGCDKFQIENVGGQVDAFINMESEIDATVAKMTLAEKVRLCSGDHTMRLPANERLKIPEWWFTDSSHTVRADLKRWDWGYEDGKKPAAATVLPTLSALAATWNVERAKEHGEVMGAQTRARGKDMFLGPGVNIMRTPLCGRNWEYLGEDPVLNARLVVALIKRAQDFDVAACIKHFCLNNQEKNRFEVAITCDERTLREIYLPTFEAAVREGGVLGVMNAYDKFRGLFCSESAFLQKEILRQEWGFKGLTITDWGAMHDGVKAALGGTDVEMNRGVDIVYYNNAKKIFDQEVAQGGFISNAQTQPLAEAVRTGKVPENVVDDMVRHILYVYAQVGKWAGRQKARTRASGAIDTPRHREIARKIAEEAIVLLKNDAQALPFQATKMRKVLVLGRLAETAHSRFGYSAEGVPPYEITPLEALKARLGSACEITMLPLRVDGKRELAPKGALAADASDKAARIKAIRQSGGNVETRTSDEPEPQVDEAYLAKVKALARAADAVLLFTGTWVGHGRALECEGDDRPDMRLPVGHDAMIARVLDWQLPQVVVINHSGSPCEMPWAAQCKTLVQQPYCGQEGGRALVSVLFGDVNPSGKLPCTWPVKLADTPAERMGTYNATNSIYNERFYVGYRWYDHANITPLFPFGFGLGYSSFAYDNVRAEGLGLSVRITNTGKMAGQETVQLYVRYPDTKVERCVQELKGFSKVSLAPGASQVVRFTLTEKDLVYWDETMRAYKTEKGCYELCVGASSRDIRGRVMVRVD